MGGVGRFGRGGGDVEGGWVGCLYLLGKVQSWW